ncbi:hypothetical protein QUW44_03195 [Limosilactobacillus pontis]|uniref:Uncharacterized protein n=1 Tax=Limosilactobacillus pontis TaxID=35787 RepID=A0ABT7UWX8_9LACO|nr:hypothetical protein [Limosilactobacillus pontis]MDM8266179.1 hypothetical protein [Limosilactobacillus pontis]
MKKIVTLVEDIKNTQGQTIATMTTALCGDGATPVVQTSSSLSDSIIGYNDDGSVIIAEADDEIITAAQQKFIAAAIKEQKKLCVENGVDPDIVNILNAEKKVNINE